jgi:hypothetical protein
MTRGEVRLVPFCFLPSLGSIAGIPSATVNGVMRLIQAKKAGHQSRDGLADEAIEAGE